MSNGNCCQNLTKGGKIHNERNVQQKKLSPPYIGKIEVMLIVDKNYENT